MKIIGFMGSPHLETCDELQLKETLGFLKDFSFERFGTSHCTGQEGINSLWNVLKEKFFVAHTGVTLEITK